MVDWFLLKSDVKRWKLNVRDIYAHIEWIIYTELFAYFFLFFLPGRNIHLLKLQSLWPIPLLCMFWWELFYKTDYPIINLSQINETALHRE